MGMLYKRKVKLADGRRRELPTWWIKYHQGGRPIRESTRTTNANVARRIVRTREGDVEKGIPINPKMGRVTFEDAAKDLLNDYAINRRKSKGHVERRIKLALKPAFQGKRMLSIGTSDIRAYAANRQAQGAVNASINRELAALKRMFTLAVQGGKLHAKPHIPMLREDNVRRGFFEPEQFEAVRTQLPEALRAVVTFAYITGWRIASEILPIEWRQVDWNGRVLRLDPGTTKNREGRSSLEALLKSQFEEHKRLRDEGTYVALLFHRRGKRIKNFRGAWISACKAAGLPGRILHDFRRTAVRNLERAGVPRSSAMAMVGHKTESIYRRYAIVDAGALREAAERIDAAQGKS
jgi:integrase